MEEKEKTPLLRRRFRITAAVTVAAAVVLAVCVVLALMRLPGMHFAVYLAAVVFAFAAVYLALWTLCAAPRYSKPALIIKRCLTVCVTAAFLCFLILEGFILSGARTEDADADCLIILGAGLNGEIPSLSLSSRLDAALEYLSSRDDVTVIVSGGQGPGETITEAEAMYRYLVRRGVDGERILLEDRSTSTYENLSLSLAVMESAGFDPENTKIAIVTNEFHVFRAKLIAGELGVSAAGIAAKTPVFPLRVLYFCREAFAILYEVVF